MHYPDSRWRLRCQGKSRDDVSGKILTLKFYLTVFTSAQMPSSFQHIYAKGISSKYH